MAYLDDGTTPAGIVAQELNRIATQYREKPAFQGLISAYLTQVAEAMIATDAIGDAFDLDTAIGDQLTIIGKWLGWPRCHCVCTSPPVFGFACDDGQVRSYDVVSFCEGGSWLRCQATGDSDICIDDDDLYRAFLKARRYQIMGLYDEASLTAAMQALWGDGAYVAYAGEGRVVIAPGRSLSADETLLFQVAMRVLPIAPGIRPQVHLGNYPVFGFGTGWAGFCEDAVWLCPDDFDRYGCI